MPMPTLSPPDRPALILGTIGLVVGVILALAVVLSASKVRSPILSPLPPPLVTVPGTPSVQPAAQEGEAVRRPLFIQSRRPPPAKPVSSPPSVLVPVPELAVTGIIAGASGGIATGTDKQAKKPFRLRTGETFGSWRVEAITRTNLRLRHDDQAQDYPLITPPPIAPAPPPR